MQLSERFFRSPYLSGCKNSTHPSSNGRCLSLWPTSSTFNILQHCFWENLFWSDETKVRLFGHNSRKCVLRQTHHCSSPNKTIATLYHGGGCRSFAWTGAFSSIPKLNALFQLLIFTSSYLFLLMFVLMFWNITKTWHFWTVLYTRDSFMRAALC